MSAWDDIRDNFKNLMEVEIASDPDGNKRVKNLYRETPSGIEIKLNPSSYFNGAYSLSAQGIRTTVTEVNGMLSYDYLVQIQIGYIINQEAKNDPDTSVIDNSKTEYNTAISDIEEIVRKRLDVSTWIKDGAYQVDQIVFQSAGPLTFLDDVENFATCNLSFLVSREVTF